MDKMEAIPTAFMDDPVFRRLSEEARVAVLKMREFYAYEKSLKTYRDNYAIAMTERAEGFAEGYAEGFAEGYAETFAEGYAETLAEGRAEVKFTIARNLVMLGLPTETIAAATGLSVEEIDAMR